MGRKKPWVPAHGAMEGDVTEHGVIVKLDLSGDSHTFATMDRPRTSETTVNAVINMDGVFNWSRTERILERIITDKKAGSKRPVFGSMLKVLKVLWECTSQEAYEKSEDIEALQNALAKTKVKKATVIRKKTDMKFGL